MIIGEWEVEVIDIKEFHTIPDNINSPIQRIITYRFHHNPTKFDIERRIHYIDPHTAEQVSEVITKLAAELKKNFVDVFIVGRN